MNPSERDKLRMDYALTLMRYEDGIYRKAELGILPEHQAIKYLRKIGEWEEEFVRKTEE